MLVARIAGWALIVRSSSSAGPSAMRRLIEKPSAASARSMIACASGERSSSAVPMPTYCDPWPGNTKAWWRVASAGGLSVDWSVMRLVRSKSAARV